MDMSFRQKIKQAFRSFMAGRNGADQLSLALLWSGLLVYLLGILLRAFQGNAVCLALGLLFSLMGCASYILCVFRMFSRNRDKRAAENRRYMAFTERKRTEARQARVRFRNRKKYKYFKCPGCHAWLRVPRGAGVVTVTCSRCHNSFTQKA